MPGRPQFQPTKEQRDSVIVLAGGGVREDLIAMSMKIDPKTLRKHFRDELDSGRTIITKQAIATLVRAMQDGGRGAVGAAAFWLKCREGWEERHVISGPNGGAIELDVSGTELLASRLAGIAARRRAGIGAPKSE